MERYTQELADPNCVQTTIACLLGVSPGKLPRQHSDPGLPSYLLLLGPWLAERGFRFAKVPPEKFGRVLAYWRGRPGLEGYHAMMGASPRTPQNGREHMLVGQRGKVAWDPHPSRAGLTRVREWGLLLRLWNAKVPPRGPKAT